MLKCTGGNYIDWCVGPYASSSEPRWHAFLERRLQPCCKSKLGWNLGGITVSSVDVTHPPPLQVAGGKLGKTSYPMSSHAVMAAAKGAAENGAIAMISANRASTLGGSPTKASATLLCRQSFGLMGGTGAWEPAAGATDPIRVLLGLPAEEAETVLQQFQDQVRLIQNWSVVATAGSIPCCRQQQSFIGSVTWFLSIRCPSLHAN